MGGFIAQALALNYADHIDKLVLLSTDPGGIEADLASPDVWSKLVDTSGTPHEQARRLFSLLFPGDVAEAFYRPIRRYRRNGARAVITRPSEAPGCGDGRMASQRCRQSITSDTPAGANRYRHGRHCDPSFKRAKARERNSRCLACSISSRRPC